MFLNNFLILFGFLVVLLLVCYLVKKIIFLQSTIEKCNQILNEVEDGYYEVDLNGNITFVTMGALKLFGYSQEEVIGLNFIHTMTHEDGKKLYEKFHEVFVTGIPQKNVQYKAYSKNNTLLYLETSVSLRKKNNDEILGFRGVTRDISSRKKVALAFKKAKEKAESANEAKGRFLANMSHEIRTPLEGVIGMTRILRESELDSEQLRKLDIILQSSESLLAIINDILDFSKIEAGQLILKQQKVNVRLLVNIIKDLFSSEIIEKGFDFNIDIDPCVPHEIITDELRLKQILVNLIGNSLKFTEKGYILVSSWIENRERTDFIAFKVRDIGIGIKSENISSVFEYFNQSDNSNSREYGGTGLGLAITKELITLMGGKIGVKSEIGKGTVFLFYLPLKKYNFDELKNDTFVKSEIITKDSTDYILNWMNDNGKQYLDILVVEDNPVNQEVLSRYLSILPVNIKLADNGVDAFDIICRSHFDIIFMDIQMPGMSGIETVQKLRIHEKQNRIQETPVIGVTAQAMAGDSEKCILAGMSDYITKPVDRDLLIRTLASTLKVQC